MAPKMVLSCQAELTLGVQKKGLTALLSVRRSDFPRNVGTEPKCLRLDSVRGGFPDGDKSASGTARWDSSRGSERCLPGEEKTEGGRATVPRCPRTLCGGEGTLPCGPRDGAQDTAQAPW